MGFASSFPGGGYHSAPDTPSTDGIDFVGALGAAPADVQTGLGIAAANGYSVDSGNQLSIPQYTPEQAELANAVATELGQTTSANQQTSINNAVLAQQYNQMAQPRGTPPPTFIQKQTSKAKDVLSDYFLTKDSEGNLMPFQTGLGLVGKATGPPGMLATGVIRGFLDMFTFNRDSAIESELQALAAAEGQTIENKDMPAAIEAYYTAEHAENQARGEADLSPSMPRRLLSQGQQDPAAQPTASALFGPTHIYGALPGQRQRRGAYQYIPPTFGPIRS